MGRIFKGIRKMVQAEVLAIGILLLLGAISYFIQSLF
jgi:hypothetical protein